MLERLHALIKQEKVEKEEKEKGAIKVESEVDHEESRTDEPGKSPRHFAVIANEGSKSPGSFSKGWYFQIGRVEPRCMVVPRADNEVKGFLWMGKKMSSNYD